MVLQKYDKKTLTRIEWLLQIGIYQIENTFKILWMANSSHHYMHFLANYMNSIFCTYM